MELKLHGLILIKEACFFLDEPITFCIYTHLISLILLIFLSLCKWEQPWLLLLCAISSVLRS